MLQYFVFGTTLTSGGFQIAGDTVVCVDDQGAAEGVDVDSDEEPEVVSILASLLAAAAAVRALSSCSKACSIAPRTHDLISLSARRFCVCSRCFLPDSPRGSALKGWKLTRSVKVLRLGNCRRNRTPLWQWPCTQQGRRPHSIARWRRLAKQRALGMID